MQLKVLQLNAYAGTYWEALSNYLHTNTFDILQLQEMVGEHTRVGNIDTKENIYQEISKLLGNGYQGRLYKTETFSSSPTSYDGVATFVRKDITILEEKNIIQKEAVFPFDSDRKDFENVGRGALALKVTKENKPFWLLNTHLAWSPNSEDTDEKIKQATILFTFLKKLSEPFIFTGDLNANPQTKTIKIFDEIAQNVNRTFGVINTLNPRLHKADVFPPGLIVDYFFVSNDISVKEFAVVEDDISDHLGLTATIRI